MSFVSFKNFLKTYTGASSPETDAAVARLQASFDSVGIRYKDGSPVFNKDGSAVTGSGSGSGAAAAAAASTVSASAAPLAKAAEQAVLLVKWRGLPNKRTTHVDKLIFEEYDNLTAVVPRDVRSDELRPLIFTAGQQQTRSVTLKVDDLARLAVKAQYCEPRTTPMRFQLPDGTHTELTGDVVYSSSVNSLEKPEQFEANQTYVMEVSLNTNNNPYDVSVSGKIVKMAPVAGDEKKAKAGNEKAAAGNDKLEGYRNAALQWFVQNEVVALIGLKAQEFGMRVMTHGVDVSTVEFNAKYPEATEVLRNHLMTVDPKLLEAVSIKVAELQGKQVSLLDRAQLEKDVAKLYFDMMTQAGLKKVLVTFLEGMLSGQRPQAIDAIFAEMGARFAEICFNQCKGAKTHDLQMPDSGSAASGSGSGAGAAATSNSAGASLGASAAGAGAGVVKDPKVVDSGSAAGGSGAGAVASSQPIGASGAAEAPSHPLRTEAAGALNGWIGGGAVEWRAKNLIRQLANSGVKFKDKYLQPKTGDFAELQASEKEISALFERQIATHRLEAVQAFVTQSNEMAKKLTTSQPSIALCCKFLTPQGLEKVMMAYLEGALAQEKTAAVDEHFKKCASEYAQDILNRAK